MDGLYTRESIDLINFVEGAGDTFEKAHQQH